MRKFLIVFGLLASLTAGTARAQFCPGVAPWVFRDVPASDPFCGHITWMATTGITHGCLIIDANNRNFCPDQFVTRGQMSAFLSRLGKDAAFAEGGNAFGALPDATAILGTSDGNALDIRVNGARVMRYEPNSISPNVIGGSPANSLTAGVRGATIAGGGVPAGNTDPDYTLEGPNRVTDNYGTVGGGYGNRAGSDNALQLEAPWATVAGGDGNTASGAWSTVGGGARNTASGQKSTLAGGDFNTASGHFSVVTGGLLNQAAQNYDVVAGGVRNVAGGGLSSVAGGQLNSANGSFSSVAGGFANVASSSFSIVAGGSYNIASGNYSIVAGGNRNVASGILSFAAGHNANATHDNSFVWSGSSAGASSAAAGEFVVYAPSLIRLSAGNVGTGNCEIGTGGVGGNLNCDGAITAVSFVPISDRALKSAIVPVSAAQVLAQVAALPIAEWSYTAIPGVRHMGPMGQDFYAAFALGATDKGIATVDADGVALAAIQGLNAKLESAVAAKDAEIRALKREISELRASQEKEIADLRLAVDVLMARTPTEGRVAQSR